MVKDEGEKTPAAAAVAGIKLGKPIERGVLAICNTYTETNNTDTSGASSLSECDSAVIIIMKSAREISQMRAVSPAANTQR